MPKKRPPKLKFPIAIAKAAEHAYKADQCKHLVPVVGKILALYDDPTGHTDAIPTDILREVAKLRLATQDPARIKQIERTAAKIARQFDRINAQQVNRQLGSLGIKPALAAATKARVQKFVQQNVSYITGLDKTMRDQVLDLVERAYVHGTAKDTLKKQLVERIGVSESKAALIARDQGNKFFGDMTRARHEAAGVLHYEWSTSQDERVRDEHQILDGKVFAYSDPPDEGNPGEAVLCRCTAIPVISDAED